MKVLFAIRDDNNIVDTIVRKYQRDYNKKLVYKEVKNFTAILRELQQNNNYDRIVISDDIDEKINKSENKSKLILTKLKSIRSVALKDDKQIPIIFFSDNNKLTNYLYELNIYNGIIGTDITKKRIYELMLKPRNRLQAKDYYKINDEVVNKAKKTIEKVNKKNVENKIRKDEKKVVKSEKNKIVDTNKEKSNNLVSDVEKAIKYLNQVGLDEEKYVKKFDNICSKLSKEELQIVIKSLSLRTKKILKNNSSKYNKLVSVVVKDNEKTKAKEESTVKRGRGRPRKEKKEEEPAVKRKRGRPRKTVESIEENEPIKKNVEENKEKKTKLESKKKLEDKNKTVKKEKNEEDLDFEENDLLSKERKSFTKSKTKNKEKIEENLDEISKNKVDDDELDLDEKDDDLDDVKYNDQDLDEDDIEDDDDLDLDDEDDTDDIEDNDDLNIDEDDTDNIDDDHNNKENTSNSSAINNNTEDDEIFDLDDNEFYDEKNAKSSENKNDDDFVFDVDDEKSDDEDVDDSLNLVSDTDDDDILNLDDEFNIEDTNKNENSADDDDADILNLDNDDLKVDDNQIGINQPGQFSGIRNKNYNPNYDISKQINEINGNTDRGKTEEEKRITIPEEKKIVAFVGAHGNGTSFIINNLALLLSEQGIKTAIVDLTKNKNSYYIFTQNEERLRGIAYSCFEKLKSGISDGIIVNKNLTVYTSLPNADSEIENKETAINTLLSEFSLVLFDCDTETDQEYFEIAQEIYLVQSLDVLTIQPLTTLLKKLKMNKLLNEEKLRILINKDLRVNKLNERILISAMSVYNSPDTTYQLDLFNRDKIGYLTIPFEEKNYSKYLDELADCKLTIRGYSKNLISSFNKLAKFVYPINGKKRK